MGCRKRPEIPDPLCTRAHSLTHTHKRKYITTITTRNSFGDRVKYWITVNEPWCAAVLGHDCGQHAPGRSVDPAHEVYKVAHHMLIAHGCTYQLYQ